MNGRALIAWNVRRIRVGRRISQERLAFNSGIDRSYVGGIERQAENPTVDLLDRLARTLGVELSELFAEPKAKEKKPEGLKRGRHPLKSRSQTPR